MKTNDELKAESDARQSTRAVFLDELSAIELRIDAGKAGIVDLGRAINLIIKLNGLTRTP